jgi:hypothetical protein
LAAIVAVLVLALIAFTLLEINAKLAGIRDALEEKAKAR